MLYKKRKAHHFFLAPSFLFLELHSLLTVILLGDKTDRGMHKNERKSHSPFDSCSLQHNCIELRYGAQRSAIAPSRPLVRDNLFWACVAKWAGWSLLVLLAIQLAFNDINVRQASLSSCRNAKRRHALYGLASHIARCSGCVRSTEGSGTSSEQPVRRRWLRMKSSLHDVKAAPSTDVREAK